MMVRIEKKKIMNSISHDQGHTFIHICINIKLTSFTIARVHTKGTQNDSPSIIIN